MAYDEELADRIRALVTSEDGLTEKKMFGGLAFLIHGNMSVSASSQGGLLAALVLAPLLIGALPLAAVMGLCGVVILALSAVGLRRYR